MPTHSPILWAYAYRLSPPLPAAKLRQLRALLDTEHVVAHDRAGKWEARFVTDARVVHILVLADSPDLNGVANKRIEAELLRLGANYSLTVPLAVSDGGEDIPPKD